MVVRAFDQANPNVNIQAVYDEGSWRYGSVYKFGYEIVGPSYHFGLEIRPHMRVVPFIVNPRTHESYPIDAFRFVRFQKLAEGQWEVRDSIKRLLLSVRVRNEYALDVSVADDSQPISVNPLATEQPAGNLHAGLSGSKSSFEVYRAMDVLERFHKEFIGFPSQS